MVPAPYPTSGVRAPKKTAGCFSSVKNWFSQNQARVPVTHVPLSTLAHVNQQPQMEIPMKMVRLPAATQTRAGHQMMSDMPDNRALADDGDLPDSAVNLRIPGTHRQKRRPIGMQKDRNHSNGVEKELCTYLKAVVAGETARLPPRPDLGFKYNVVAVPPNVLLSIMPSISLPKSVRTVPLARYVPVVQQAVQRRSLVATYSFDSLDCISDAQLHIRNAGSQKSAAQSAIDDEAVVGDDSSDDDEYEYGTVIKARKDGECLDIIAYPETAVSSSEDPDDEEYEYGTVLQAQARQGIERLVLSTTSSEDDGECELGLVLQTRQAEERMMLSASSMADEDQSRTISSTSSSDGDDEDQPVPVARPASRRQALSIDSDSYSVSLAFSTRQSDAYSLPLVEPRRPIRVDSPMVFAGAVARMNLRARFKADMHRGLRSASRRAEDTDVDNVVPDQVLAWVNLNPECTAMLFASPAEGCMQRFAYLWDDELAEPIDQSLFADFDGASSDAACEPFTDERRNSWSVGDASLSYGSSTEASYPSTDSRCNSWSAGDEVEYQDIFVPGRGDPARQERFLTLVTAEDVCQKTEQCKGNGRPRRTFNEFYQLYTGTSISTLLNDR